ncbi:hypothetical protein K438DRAFT_447712 [Mycena galopus ATCC 62051]|nr:hypothetical protein K438DRAFT_447712 [Mycena galopus ATCC 62051]
MSICGVPICRRRLRLHTPPTHCRGGWVLIPYTPTPSHILADTAHLSLTCRLYWCWCGPRSQIALCPASAFLFPFSFYYARRRRTMPRGSIMCMRRPVFPYFSSILNHTTCEMKLVDGAVFSPLLSFLPFLFFIFVLHVSAALPFLSFFRVLVTFSSLDVALGQATTHGARVASSTRREFPISSLRPRARARPRGPFRCMGRPRRALRGSRIAIYPY